MRVLSSSSSDDGEGDDNDDSNGGDGGGVDDDNNEGNNSNGGGTYSLEGHMQMLSLTSSQYYGVTYVHDYRPQLERSTSTSIYLSTYRRDDYDEDFVLSQFNVEITTLACIYECSLCN